MITTTSEYGGTSVAPVAARPRRAAAVALLAGTLLAATALSMHLRGGGADLDFLRHVGEDPTRWLVGHVLMTIGGVLLLLGLTAVPALARARGRRLVATGSVLAGIGAASTALGDFAHGALAYVLIDDVPVEKSLEIQNQFYEQPLLALISMPSLLLPIGMLVLGLGLLISRAVPVAAGVLVLVAPIAVQAGYVITALPMPVMVLPLVVGLGWTALLVGRKRQT